MFFERRLAIVAALAAAAAGLLPVSWPAAVAIVSGTLAVLAAIDVLRAPDPRSLRARRLAAASVEIGSASPIEISVVNPLRRPLAVALHDATPPSLGRTPRRQRRTIPPGEVGTFRAILEPSRRGWMQIGPATLRTTGPLGLAGRQRAVGELAGIKVYPPLPGRAEVERRFERARALQSGRHSSAYRGGGTEFDALREYHPDDEFRRINWTATARAQKAITNLYREQRDQQILLLVDASRMMVGTLGDRTKFEYAVDTAHALTELATRVGDRVGLVAFGEEIRAMAAPSGGRQQSATVLDLLFRLEPSLDAPDYHGAFGSLLSRYRRRAMLVLLTDLSEPEAMDSLFASIPVLRARHLVVVGAVRDPDLQEAERIRPDRPDDAYFKAAASASAEAREQSANRLRAMGVDVLDREPGALTGAIADHYLDIKARGRL
jgi:uncharacterized protein (DUF58 family)